MEQHIFLFLASYVFMCYGRTFKDIISYYEPLNREDFSHKVYRRSLPEFPNQHERDIKFSCHGRYFHMKLRQATDLFDANFQVVSIDRYGKETPVDISKDYFYEGYVDGDPTSSVTAHVDDDGFLTATVSMSNETYSVEPMRNHVDGDPSHDVIVYKASDLKWNITRPGEEILNHVAKCGNNETEIEVSDDVINNEPSDRERRSTSTAKNTCKLNLIADYKFCVNVGRKNPKTTAYYMIQVINQVDKYFRQTEWDTGVGKGIGVQIKRTEVHCDDYTSKPNYNSNRDWDVNALLREISLTNWNDYCLAHLFTYRDFAQGVVGLAYVANPRSRYGGICSPKAYDRTGLRMYNCGLTSHVNWGRRLTSLEANLVTTHELGHNFGSKHDSDDNDQCAPGGNKGNYVMYAISVTGTKSNNKLFSSCSKKQIGDVIANRASRCLESKSAAFCGNGVKEEGEDCDQGTKTKDKCCRQCKFINGATCSDAHSMCCKDCKMAPKNGKVCRPKYQVACLGETLCDGTSMDCPNTPPPLTGGVCNRDGLKKGECKVGGKCESLCEPGFVSCSCGPGENSCKVCCKPAGAGADSCSPRSPTVTENDGVSCTHSGSVLGLCESGKCKKLKQDVKATFKDLLTDFTIGKAVQWMKNNIVITILIFSLLLWLPAGGIVSLVDYREEQTEKEREEEMFSRQSRKRGSFKKEKRGRPSP